LSKQFDHNNNNNIFEHIEPFNRPLLPKQQSSKKFFAMIEILNQFILPKFVNNTTSFRKLHSIIYSGALTIIRLNGSKEIDQTNNIKAKELPKWERRLNKRINNIRRDLGRITQYLKGINSNHLNNCIKSILNKNRIHCLKYNEYNETLIEIKDTLLQKLNIYSKRLKRYKNNKQRKFENKLFRNNEKLFYKNLADNKTQNNNGLKNYFLNRARDNTFFNALVSADKGYTPLNLSDNIISDIVKPNIPDTIANIKQKSLHGRYFKELEQPEVNIQASHAWLKKSNIHPETEGFIFAIQDRVINTRNYKKHICGLQSIIDKCRICGTEGETIEHIISSCTVLAQSEYKKRHDIFAKIIHMNLAVKFNLLKNTQPHYSYTPESCLENDSYKLYFDRTILTDIHIKHNRPDIIILNKQQKQAYLLDIAVPNSHNITQTYNTKINKYLELSVAMRNLWCLEKISILPLVISATGIVPQSLFKNLKILDLDNTLVVEIQKGILLYSCHIVRKFLNIDTEHNTQQSQNAEARRR
jgi:hypothetical protein